MHDCKLFYLNLKCVPRRRYSVNVGVGSIAVSCGCIVLVLDLIMHACVQIVQYLTTFAPASADKNKFLSSFLVRVFIANTRSGEENCDISFFLNMHLKNIELTFSTPRVLRVFVSLKNPL